MERATFQLELAPLISLGFWAPEWKIYVVLSSNCISKAPMAFANGDKLFILPTAFGL